MPCKISCEVFNFTVLSSYGNNTFDFNRYGGCERHFLSSLPQDRSENVSFVHIGVGDGGGNVGGSGTIVVSGGSSDGGDILSSIYMLSLLSSSTGTKVSVVSSNASLFFQLSALKRKLLSTFLFAIFHNGGNSTTLCGTDTFSSFDNFSIFRVDVLR